MPLVESIARKVARKNRHVELGELMSDGALGLADAVDRYRGMVKFETFAWRRIQGAMVDAMRQREWVPRTALKRGDARRMVRMAEEVDPAAAGDGAEELDLEACEELRRRTAVLEPELRRVVHLHYGCGLTMKDVGQRLGLSESRISQLHDVAIRVMRAAASSSQEQAMSANGNGKHELARRDAGGSIEQMREAMELPPWLKSLRDAMGSAIGGDDLKQIMQVQVEAAKGGDLKAANFVMNQAHKMLQTGKPPPITVTQNNYYDSPRPDTPLEPGTDDLDRERVMRSRARAGEPVISAKDRRHTPISDEEEKKLRRQEEAAKDE